MSNEKGVYVGVCVRCTVEKVTELSYNKQCPVCKIFSANFCPQCGAKTERLPYTNYPMGGAVLEDYDNLLAWLPNRGEWQRGVLCFVSNQRGDFSIDTDPGAPGMFTAVTPEVLQRQVEAFRIQHAAGISYLQGRCLSVEVLWGVVPWWEF